MLKYASISAPVLPVLACLDLGELFFLFVNASPTGIGFTLA